MALIDYLKPGYPTTTTDASGVSMTYVFVGQKAEIDPLRVNVGSTFLYGGKVNRTDVQYIESTGFIEYTVEVYFVATEATYESTDQQYPYFEIDYVQIEKNIKQHPDFITFTDADMVAINAWEAEVNQDFKSKYQYRLRDEENKPTGETLTLSGTTSAGQKAYAYLRLRGVESFLDFAPVVRRTSKYFGSSAPASSDAGQKTTAPTYAPSGYEWLKTADRINKQGTRGIEWLRQEEWTGARKVLLDKDELFT